MLTPLMVPLLALALQEPPAPPTPPAAPAADAPPAPAVAPLLADPAAIGPEAVCKPAPGAAVAAARAVPANALQPFARAERAERTALGLGAASAGAGMIAASITYLAASELDKNLDPKNAVDSRTAGVVLGIASLVPLSVAGVELLLPSSTERASASLENGAPAAQVKSEIEAEGMPLLPIVGGAALIGGGLVSAGAGAYFLALPHIPPHRGVISHSTGAELIALATGMIGIGIVTIVFAGGDTEGELAALTP